MNFNPELDEVTATALCIQLNNQVAALKAWERKLRQPFMPTSNKVHYLGVTPIYPKPTAATVLHIIKGNQHAVRDMAVVLEKFLKGERVKENV